MASCAKSKCCKAKYYQLSIIDYRLRVRLPAHASPATDERPLCNHRLGGNAATIAPAPRREPAPMWTTLEPGAHRVPPWRPLCAH